LHNIYLQILSRYKNINNIIHYATIYNITEYIVDSEPQTLNNIALRYTIEKIDKKIGEKNSYN